MTERAAPSCNTLCGNGFSWSWVIVIASLIAPLLNGASSRAHADDEIQLPLVPPLRIEIDSGGFVSVEGEEVEAESLRGMLADRAGTHLDESGACKLPSLLRCDTRVPFSLVREVLLASAAGRIHDVRLAVATGSGEETSLAVRVGDPVLVEQLAATAERIEVMHSRNNGVTQVTVGDLVERLAAGDEISSGAPVRADRDRFREVVRELRAGMPGAPVVVRARDDVPYGDVVSSVSVLNRIGVRTIFFDPGDRLLPLRARISDRGPSAAGSDREAQGPAGSDGVVRMIERALDWLAAHQDPAGYWDADLFAVNCRDDVVCEGKGYPAYDVGLTGLALLAFLNDGNTHEIGPHRETVKRALVWLENQQDAEGCFGVRTQDNFTYGHAIATQAMVRAFRLTGSTLFERPAQSGIDFVERCRNPYGAWRYGVRPGDNDTSVTSWMLLALVEAERAGLRIDRRAVLEAREFIISTTDQAGRAGYVHWGTPPVRPVGKELEYPAEHSESLTAAALLCRVLSGEKLNDHEILQKSAALCAAKPPVWEPARIDCYYWYYGAHAMNQVGGERRDAWQQALVQALRSSQDTSRGCRDGSWDAVGPWSEQGGRVYSTAMFVLALQAPFVYPVR